MLWDQHVFLDDNGLSVNITRIRNKLKALGAGPVIEQREDWDICYEFTGIFERQSACLSGQDFVHAAAFLLSSVSGEPVG